MKILVINSGSSSIKFKLLDLESLSELASGFIEQIGEETSHELEHFIKDGQEKVIEYNHVVKNHKEGLELVNNMLIQTECIASMQEVDAIGHRVVHGGEKFHSATLVTDETLKELEKLIPLAPLHNPANITGIKEAMAYAPNVPQVAVFDTAFHQSMPKHAFIYALPYELYEKNRIRRYGFHGTSHLYVSKQAATLIQKPLETCNFITLHLGNGASVCAIKDGKSVDTSMGLTPLEGLVMGTRSGDLDPAIVFYLEKELGYSIGEIDKLLNKSSGLRGVCGVNDLREIIAREEKGDELAALAMALFCYRIKKYLGAYMAVLGEVDGIVFTGGIGENAAVVREKVCENLAIFGIILDDDKNSQRHKEAAVISTDESRVSVMVIPTNEELEIAMQTKQIIE